MFRRMSLPATLCAVGALLLTSVAVAYDVPGKARGSAGGPPTKPKAVGPAPNTPAGKEDRRVAERAAHALGLALAGFTNAELADHGPFKFKVDIPKPGKLSCITDILRPHSDFERIGSSSKTYQEAGTHPFEFEFEVSGENTLKTTERPLRLLVECQYRAEGSDYIAGSIEMVTLG